MKLPLIRTAVVIAAAIFLLDVRASDSSRITHIYNGDMTLDQAVQVALKQNPEILKALQQIELARGQVIEVRALALPHIILTGNYSQEDPRLIKSGGSTTSTSTGSNTSATSTPGTRVLRGTTPSRELQAPQTLGQQG